MINIDEDRVKKRLNKFTPEPIVKRKNSAVLIPLVMKNNRWEVLFEVRAKDMKKQPGEISFPGGRRENNESFKETAIRETMEELNVPKESIDLLGELNYLQAGNGSQIRSFLGIIRGVNVDNLKPCQNEVDHLFTVPLDYFLENEPSEYELHTKAVDCQKFPYHLIPNGINYKFNGSKRNVYFYRYNDYIIWGYTADIMRDFIKNFKNDFIK